MLTMAVNGLVRFIHWTNIRVSVTTFISCPSECEDGNKILRKDMETHKMEECPRRQYICSHCGKSSEYEETQRTMTHPLECPDMKVCCTNDGCPEHIKGHTFRKHFREC